MEYIISNDIILFKSGSVNQAQPKQRCLLRYKEVHKMTKLKFGVVGCGSFSVQHLNGLKYQKRAEVVALCDLDVELCKKRQKI